MELRSELISAYADVRWLTLFDVRQTVWIQPFGRPTQAASCYSGLAAPLPGHVAAISFLNVYTKRTQHAQARQRDFAEKIRPLQ